MICGHGNIQGPGNFQGPELLAAPGIFQGPGNIQVLEISRPPGKFQDPGYFQAPWKNPGGVLISGQTGCVGVGRGNPDYPSS